MNEIVLTRVPAPTDSRVRQQVVVQTAALSHDLQVQMYASRRQQVLAQLGHEDTAETLRTFLVEHVRDPKDSQHFGRPWRQE